MTSPRSNTSVGRSRNAKRLRVGVDARALNTRHLRGMGKTLYELLRESVAHDDVEFVLFGDEPSAPVHHPPHPRVKVELWETRGHRLHAWEQIALPWRAWRRGCDVLHYTGTACAYWQPVPTVVTIHDTLMWEEEAPSKYLGTLLPAAYRKAAGIMTISARSRADIIARWPKLADKVDVVQWGVHERYLGSTGSLALGLTELGVRPPYLLYFGGEVPRKRLGWAVDVWSKLDVPGLQLVVCGLERRSVEHWQQQVPEHLRGRFICPDFVEEDALPALYARATAVLYPTLYEGFGLPALESQAVGTPVLFSALGSLGELAGPGAVVLPPDDLGAWVAACRQILEGGRTNKDVSRQWATRFSWPQVFDQVLAVYRRAAAGERVTRGPAAAAAFADKDPG